MTAPMHELANKIYAFLKMRFDGDTSVEIEPFNHVTALFYYQKDEESARADSRKLHESMLGYHTDNVYSYDGSFVDSDNSQIENTFT